MATQNSTSTLKRADHPRPTARSHYAAMRRAEQTARSISVRSSVFGFTSQFGGDITADELAKLRATRDSYYRLAAAYRTAARKLERGERMRIRVERALRPVTRIVRSARRAVAA